MFWAPAYLLFFFNDTATTEIYTLSLHDALPISERRDVYQSRLSKFGHGDKWRDRKSTRLNSSHLVISYAVFCLKKKQGQLTHCHAEELDAHQHVVVTARHMD